MTLLTLLLLASLTLLNADRAVLWGALAAAMALLGALAYGDWVFTRRLAMLLHTTKRWAAGDFDVRSPLAKHHDDCGRIARAFNELVDALEHHLLERKQAERRERQQVVDLDRACQQLQQTQAQLVQTEKLAAIGRLASGIAHEVKNPLAILLQGVSFFEHTTAPTPAQMAEVLGLMKEAVNRADQIIKGLLVLARPASLKLVRGHLREAVNAALRLVEKDLLLKRITVVKEFLLETPMMLLDQNQMEQVFINLLSNAQHAMSQGGCLTIRISRRTLTELQVGIGRRATDRLRLGEEVVVCEVQDTGAGIPPDKLDRIFEPFFTTKPPGEGTGLGLAIVSGIIEHHRGCIEVASVVGQGTTFTILLPVAPPV